ncbi:MAG: conjugal transfer protein TraB, partial [Simkaniaceae bacterium]|nr:conjugal transfer protein TraB [Simkaniaceae bacterium]
HGNLPRGWKSRLKDAVMIGSCYGDLSSERAMCRIHSLSFVEANGRTVEKQVEGWIIGEDGSPGLRGIVVDRAGKVVREAFVAGMLSGMSNFFKSSAQSSVFPVSPFGQTDALKTDDVLKSGAAQGASNALEKLADFSIKRAEAMSPVLIVHPGRVVDVVFKKGFDLNPITSKILRPVSTSSNSQGGN